MYSFIDRLIFPAPTPSYNKKDLQGKIIYIPKSLEFQHKRKESNIEAQNQQNESLKIPGNDQSKPEMGGPKSIY